MGLLLKDKPLLTKKLESFIVSSSSHCYDFYKTQNEEISEESFTSSFMQISEISKLTKTCDAIIESIELDRDYEIRIWF